MPRDALILVEHVDRELDLVCLVRMLLQRNHGIDVEIANVSADAPSLFHRLKPKTVFFSSFYSAEWQLRSAYVSTWPHARFFSLSWEQIFCPIDLPLHQPIGDFAKNNVHYFSWFPEYNEYLLRHGVDAGKISLVGHALYQLFDEPYSRYFKTREELAKLYNLDVQKKWIFIPENYGFGFYPDSMIRGMVRAFDLPTTFEAELEAIREYCRASLAILLQWTNELAQRDDIEVIFRPRPSVDKQRLFDFLSREAGISKINFHVNKSETSRDWVMASDVVISSYSTVLIEAALARKTIRKVEPLPIPDSLRYDWCDLVSTANCFEDFAGAASESASDPGSDRLREWAKARFFPTKDPALSLANEIARHIKAARIEASHAERSHVAGPGFQKVPGWLRIVDRALPPETRHRLYRKYVSGYTHSVGGHEKDFFDHREVRRRTKRWAAIVPK